jgi:hypothetical protein
MLTSAFASLSVLFICVASCVLAFVKGSAAERLGAAVILANLVVATANYSYFGNQVADLAIDGLTATALLFLALRYAAVWLGAAMLIFAVQFGLDAYYFVLERHTDAIHDAVNNADSLAVSISLFVGTINVWRKRVAARATAPAVQAAP